MNYLVRSIIVVSIVSVSTKCLAIVQPNSLFSNNMVLQQGVTVPVWGSANEGEKVTVEFDGQKVSTTAKAGKWMLQLKPLKGGNKTKVMTISGENTIKIENVLVGEVWVCSGQSNMEMSMSNAWPKQIDNAKEEMANANYPEIRQYLIHRKASETLVEDANAKWVVCDTGSIKDFTAVGYFFARDLHKTLKVPVGIIFSAWGGTAAEYWTPSADVESVPELKYLIEKYQNAIKDFPNVLAKFKEKKAWLDGKWLKDSANAVANNKTIPNKPRAPYRPQGSVGALYNAMINPLIPYAIKGFTWYQGEANRTKAKEYRYLFPLMINVWRRNWNQSTLPFLFVQLAPYMDMNPEIREAQLLTVNKLESVGMAVITDCGDSALIHPTAKQPVGKRLSIAARSIAYKEKIDAMGPIYQSFETKNNTIELSFKYASKGLVAKGGKLIGFEIAGEDKQFLPAEAEIKGKKVIVSHPNIPNPKSVRYGWAKIPVVNLFNGEDLPASPFRTDVE